MIELLQTVDTASRVLYLLVSAATSADPELLPSYKSLTLLLKASKRDFCDTTPSCVRY